MVYRGEPFPFSCLLGNIFLYPLGPSQEVTQPGLVKKPGAVLAHRVGHPWPLNVATDFCHATNLFSFKYAELPNPQSGEGRVGEGGEGLEREGAANLFIALLLPQG